MKLKYIIQQQILVNFSIVMTTEESNRYYRFIICTDFLMSLARNLGIRGSLRAIFMFVLFTIGYT